MSCELDPKIKVKGQIMYFLFNDFPPNVRRSNLNRSYDIKGTGKSMSTAK